MQIFEHIVLKDHHKELIVGLLIVSTFLYVSVYFIDPNFLQNSPIQIPILFSICASMVIFLIGIFSAYYINARYFCDTNFGTIIAFSLSTTVNAVIITIVSFFCFLAHTGLFYYMVWLVIAAAVGMFFSMMIHAIKKHKDANDKRDADKSSDDTDENLDLC